MVLEVGDIHVTEGSEQAFVRAYRGARDALASTPGCHRVQLNQSVETPSRFVLLVEWESIEAHLENFRGSERFIAWRAAIGPYFAQPPVVEHVISVE